MKKFHNILVATDTRLESHPIVAEAAEIAGHFDAKLKIVDILPEYSWAARLNDPNLLEMLSALRREKQQRLDTFAADAGLLEMGVDFSTKILPNDTPDAIIEEAQRGHHDLVVAVAKGKNSKRKGFFGQTATQLLRRCPCPVWLVDPGKTPQSRHVLGCVDTSSDHSLDAELNDKVYKLASSLGRVGNAKFSIIHAWTMDDEALLSSRFPQRKIDGFVRDEEQYQRKRFDQFLKLQGTDADADNVHLVKGDTAETITRFVKENQVDLLVMGTVARSGLSNIFIGNTAEKILDHVQCSVLALKPYRFKSPVAIDLRDVPSELSPAT